MKKFLIFIMLYTLFTSCNNDIDVIFPEFNDGSILDGTLPVPSFSKMRMEGVYSFINGNNYF